MSQFPFSIRTLPTFAWRCSILVAGCMPFGFAVAAADDQTPRLYSLATVLLVGAGGLALGALAALFLIGRKRGEMRTLQEESNHLRNELEAIAISDTLTGLFNRRYMDAQLKMALSYARRQQIPLSIVLANVDLFKSINDDHGHQRGEQVLKGVATAIQSVLRDEDIACRYGGEEFMLILPSTDLTGSIKCAERLRAQVQSKALSNIKVTVSVGVASTESHADLNVEQLIERAEKALYAAKVRGGNMVVSEADDIDAVQMPHRHGEHPPYLH